MLDLQNVRQTLDPELGIQDRKLWICESVLVQNSIAKCKRDLFKINDFTPTREVSWNCEALPCFWVDILPTSAIFCLG